MNCSPSKFRLQAGSQRGHEDVQAGGQRGHEGVQGRLPKPRLEAAPMTTVKCRATPFFCQPFFCQPFFCQPFFCQPSSFDPLFCSSRKVVITSATISDQPPDIKNAPSARTITGSKNYDQAFDS